MSEVLVIDRVITAPGRAREFIDAYLTGYAPGARERGMTLRDVLVSPPIWFPDRTNVVTVTWTLPSPLAWWQMTWQGRPDPTLAGWWRGVADLVVDRTRSVATAVTDVAAPPATAVRLGDVDQPSHRHGRRGGHIGRPDRERVLADLQAAAAHSGAVRSVVAPTLPGSRNGGDILLHLRFDDPQAAADTEVDAALSDPAISRVNGATYRGSAVRSSAGTVYRALLLRVSPEADPATVADFERELAMMPRYVPTIAAWQLSRVDEAIGTTGWTHVFEQEFTDVDGLMGPYLMHPVHWAVVDRWFDPETTDVVVRDRVCHSFCDLVAPVL